MIVSPDMASPSLANWASSMSLKPRWKAARSTTMSAIDAANAIEPVTTVALATVAPINAASQPDRVYGVIVPSGQAVTVATPS